MINIKENDFEFGYMKTRAYTDTIVIHHIGDIDRDVTAAEIHEWHLANSWAGIGYHFVIRKDGTIERGRKEDKIGSHAYGFNAKSIGINIVGDFERATPNDAQVESAAILLAYLCDKYDIKPGEKTIVGHRDLMATTCPGQNLYDILDILRGKAIYYQQQGV